MENVWIKLNQYKPLFFSTNRWAAKLACRRGISNEGLSRLLRPLGWVSNLSWRSLCKFMVIRYKFNTLESIEYNITRETEEIVVSHVSHVDWCLVVQLVMKYQRDVFCFMSLYWQCETLQPSWSHFAIWSPIISIVNVVIVSIVLKTLSSFSYWFFLMSQKTFERKRIF